MINIIAVFVNIVVLVTLGPIADYGGARKVGPIACTSITAIMSALLVICAPNIVANVNALYSLAFTSLLPRQALHRRGEVTWFASCHAVKRLTYSHNQRLLLCLDAAACESAPHTQVGIRQV